MRHYSFIFFKIPLKNVPRPFNMSACTLDRLRHYVVPVEEEAMLQEREGVACMMIAFRHDAFATVRGDNMNRHQPTRLACLDAGQRC